MGAFAAPIAIGASLASAGFGAAGSITSGMAGKASAEAAASKAEFDAQRAERAAQFGRVQADQTDAQLREELSTTLANIDAIRASSGIDPTSPTGFAIKENEARISDRQRTSRVYALRAQADEDERTAAYDRSVAMYQRSVGRSALTAGYLGAGAKLTGGIAQGYRNPSGYGARGYG